MSLPIEVESAELVVFNYSDVLHRIAAGLLAARYFLLL